jgi:5-methylcytosine-specific restriction protein A
MPRPTAAQRGYDARWRRIRRRFLEANPTCALCPAPSQVPDHYPRSRRKLLAEGIADPDRPQYLRPLCTSCHNRETAKNQPGGWAPKGKRKRPSEKHPGLIR